jgi:hypothetical protein
VQPPSKDRQVDVLGLDVLVPEPGAVQRLQASSDGDKDVVGLPHRERPALEALGERLALVDGHRQPHEVRARAVILELNDVGVPHRREHDELALYVAPLVHGSREELERDLVLGDVEPLRDVHLAERALAEDANKTVEPANNVAHAWELGRRSLRIDGDGALVPRVVHNGDGERLDEGRA